jgi:hypothetical protein
LNSQSEIYQDEILDIQQNIHRFEQQGTEFEERRKQMLDEFECKRLQTLTLANEYDERTRMAKKIIDQCRIGQIQLNESRE